MFEFKTIVAVAAAIGLLSVRPSSASAVVDSHVRATGLAFKSTFQGVDLDGRTLVWSNDASSPRPGFVLRILPMGSASSAAESVWPVSATMTTRDSAGTPMESKLYGIIDWSRQELRLHGSCESGARSGSSVTATGVFERFDVSGTVEVLPLTASR